MNIFAKFHKNIPNLSQEIEKNTENVLPRPQKINSRYLQAKGNNPHKVFLYYSHQSIIKNICAKCHKKPNGSQEIEKKYHKTDQKIPQNGLQVRRTYYEKKFSAVSIIAIQKTSLQTFLRQRLTALNK